MSYRKIFVIPLLVLPLAACQGSNQDVGTVLGGIAGAVIGNEIGGSGTSEVIAIAAGTLAGAYIGSEIGKSMDETDRLAMQQSTQHSLEYSQSGETSSWINPDTGVSGTVTPQAPYQAPETNQHCREYQQTVTIGGQQEEAYGTACRQPDGSWKIVNSD